MDGCFDLHDSALRMLGGGLCALGDDVDAFYDCTLLFNLHREDTACLAAVVAGEYYNVVAFLDVKLVHFAFDLLRVIQRLQYLGGEGDDFHVCSAELAGNRTEDTGSTELTGIVKEHASVIVEADV